MDKVYCELIKFYSNNGYIYSGLFFPAKNISNIVIHVHGSCGDFISFSNIKTIAKYYLLKNISLLTFNLRGHDCIAEGYWKNNYFEYIGGSITLFDECIEDIRNAIKFCKQYSDKIILQGHSLGCDRVIHYQLSEKDYYNTILLSPCDSYALQQIFLGDKSIDKHIEDIENIQINDEKGILPINSYGILNNGENYYIPVSKRTLLSIMKGAPYKLFRLDKRIDYYIPTNCITCIGKKDSLQTSDPEEMLAHLETKFKNVEKTIIDADHEFEPEGEKLGQILSTWVSCL